MSVNSIIFNEDQHTLYQQYFKNLNKYQLLTLVEENDFIPLKNFRQKAIKERLSLSNFTIMGKLV